MGQAHLDDTLVLLKDRFRLLEVPAQVVGDSECDPVLSQLRAQPEEGMARLYEIIVQP